MSFAIREQETTTSRIIHRSGDEDFLQRLLEAICIAELLSPSNELWLFAAWISDFRILDNTRGVAAGIVPEWPNEHIKLSQWLRELAEAGTDIRLMTNCAPENNGIHYKMGLLAQGLPAGRIQTRRSDTLHDKGMIGQEFYLRGSFNFTRNGILVLKEHGQYDTSLSIVSQARLEAKAEWERDSDTDEDEEE